MKNSKRTVSLFAIGLISLYLTGCAGKPASPLVVTKTSAIRLEGPDLVPCERVSAEENSTELQSNNDLWQLKERAIKLLDTCADQVDARILRSNSR